MSIEAAIYSRLSGYAGLTALVSTRIYPGKAPQDVTEPYITYRKIAHVEYPAMGTNAAVSRDRFQFSIFDTTPEGVISISEQLNAALDRWSGTAASVTVQAVFLENETDLTDPVTDLPYRVSDFAFHHEG